MEEFAKQNGELIIGVLALAIYVLLGIEKVMDARHKQKARKK